MTRRSAVITLVGLVGLAAMPGLQAQESLDLSAIGTTCLATELDDCHVRTAGYFNRSDFGDEDGAPLIAWQTQIGTSEMDGYIGGFVLLRHDGEGWSVFDSGFDGFFEAPRLNPENVLHIPGYSQGTGAFNMDRLYRLEEDGTTWTPIDMNNWLEGVQLPDDLEIWKGVAFDFSNPWSGYFAISGLWAPDDGNCCPSGGEARIKLDIVDDKVVGSDVIHTPPEEGSN